MIFPYNDSCDINMDPLKFSDIYKFQATLERDQGLSLLVFGTTWNPVSIITWQNAWKVRADINKSDKLSHNLRILLVDEEMCRDFCESEGILVGLPAVLIWKGGKRLKIAQDKDSTEKYMLNGPLNFEQFHQLIECAKVLDMSNSGPVLTLKLT